MDNINKSLDALYKEGITVEEIQKYYNKRKKEAEKAAAAKKEEERKYNKYKNDCENARHSLIEALNHYFFILAPDQQQKSLNDYTGELVEYLKYLEDLAYKSKYDKTYNLNTKIDYNLIKDLLDYI